MLLRPRLLGILCFGFVLCFAATASHAAPNAVSPDRAPALTTSQSKNVHIATFKAADDQAIHATLRDGTAIDAEIHPSSLFLVNGLAAGPADFKPGATVLLRTRTRASDGAVSVVMLCDSATAIAIEAYRKKPLVGKVVSADDKALVVQPDGPAATMVTLRITPKTVYRKAGQVCAGSAFPAGSPVAVITRGLPSGILMASIVSDRSTDALSEKTAIKPVSLAGTAVEVDMDKGLLTIAPKTKPRQTIAVISTTSIKVEAIEAALADIAKGMRVSARLSHQKDAEGHAIATSVSAFPIKAKAALRKTVPAKTAPSAATNRQIGH